MDPKKNSGFSWQRHLNKLRWLILGLVFGMLILLPYISIYQNFLASHAYDFLAADEIRIYDTLEWLTKPFVGTDHAAESLNAIKGTTWSGTFFGVQLSDPLAVVGQIASQRDVYWPFLLTALIPIGLTVFFGRFYCGWICPATFIYEIVDKISLALRRVGFPTGGRRLNRWIKYLVLVMGAGFSFLLGNVAFSAIYPPALIGRELYYFIAMKGIGAGTIFFAVTILFDVMVSRRGFCRYLCPGGALYGLLGGLRPVRLQRIVSQCNDCTLCDKECQFGLHPMTDQFGIDCNNCTACIAVCPTDAISFRLALSDQPAQGHGHLGPTYKREQQPNTTDQGS